MNWNLGFTIFINQWWLYALEYKIEIIKKKQIDKNYIYIYKVGIKWNEKCMQLFYNFLFLLPSLILNET